MLRSQFLQHVRRRGIAGLGFFASRQLHLLKQDLSQLFGGIDVKGTSRLLMNALLQFLNPGHQSISITPKFLPAHCHALLLHLVEHQRQRHLHLVHQLPHTGLCQLPLYNLSGLQSHICLVLVKDCQLLQVFRRGLRQVLFSKALLIARNRQFQMLRGNSLSVVIAL